MNNLLLDRLFTKWRMLSRPRKCLLFALLPVVLFLAVPPDVLSDVSFSRAVLDRNGNLLRLTLSEDGKYRLFVPLSRMAPALPKAVLLYEDKYFYDHPGINPVSILHAAWRHMGGSGRGGASTITMQLARIKYGIKSQTLAGKLWQMVQALRIELHYSKDRILEAYLNLAPYGTNIEGIGAAGYIYFAQSPQNLSLPEVWTLAVIPQSPALRTPGKSTASNAKLAVARIRMFNEWSEAYPADKTYATLLTKPVRYKHKSDLPFIAPQLTTRLLKENKSDTIQSTIDGKLQEPIARMMKRYAEHHLELGIHNAAALLVDNRTMEVMASIGSVDFFNMTQLGMLDGTHARRSPGSALKPFIYALAFDQGIIHPLSLLKDAPIAFASYTPDNFDRQYQGPLSAHDALIKSRNIPALWVAEQLRSPDFYHFLASADIGRLKPQANYGLSLVLGGAEVTMEELVRLYAMLANGGMLRALSYTVDTPLHDGKQLLSPEASFLTLDILSDTPVPGGAALSDHLPVPVYWKTGTSSGMRDAWSVGIFGNYTLAVWVGDFHGSTHGKYVGITSAAPLFFEIMRLAATQEKTTDVIADKATHLHIARKFACSDTGDIDNPYCPSRQPVWVIPGISPIKPTDIYRRVLVDNATGKLACRFRPDETSYRVVEFWPSDLNEIFAKAGIIKSPPPTWEDGCQERQTSHKNMAPHILSPAKGLSYHIREGSDNRLVLKAALDGAVQNAFWFVNNEPVGKAKPDDPLFWPLKHGRFVVRVIDDLGNTDSRMIVVE